jgi:2-C-methyl-D-erythritol 4-phosphate cytidylyltransferase/2-C-methyl-D-erythritol 2,4-cyclodiphosphate synthase
VKERQGHINHVDITLICEAPKLTPHRKAMIACIRDILGLSDNRISIKATTTERLGFTGRGEGIAAQATATIALPC